MFILSSHLWEAWEQIKDFSGVSDYFLESLILVDKPEFTYRLIRGVSEMRLGMTMIQNENIIELLKQQSHDKN